MIGELPASLCDLWQVTWAQTPNSIEAWPHRSLSFQRAFPGQLSALQHYPPGRAGCLLGMATVTSSMAAPEQGNGNSWRQLKLIETLGLKKKKKTFKIIRFNHQSDLPIPVTKPGPSVPHPHVSSILPGGEALLFLWAPVPKLCVFMSRNKVNGTDGNTDLSIICTLHRKIHALIQVPLIQN